MVAVNYESMKVKAKKDPKNGCVRCGFREMDWHFVEENVWTGQVELLKSKVIKRRLKGIKKCKRCSRLGIIQ